MITNTLLNEHDAARELGVTVAAMRAWRIRRQGPDYIKLGRLVRYEADALTRFKSQNTRHMPAGGDDARAV